MTSKRIYGPYKREASSLCFGTMQFGAGATEADSAKMYEACRAAGVNFFDTAYVYTEGQSEDLRDTNIANHWMEPAHGVMIHSKTHANAFICSGIVPLTL